MYRSRLILATLVLSLVPFLAIAAEEPGIIGNNLGLDFYSRIDDAGDSLAQGIVRRRLTDKGTYGALGCGASWLAGEQIRQSDLDALRSGNTAILIGLASRKQTTLTTVTESSLRQCLVEKYNQIDRVAHQDQDTLETVGNVGLYLDGDTANSDYDILTDITRINSIIFKEKIPYTGTKNVSALAIADLLAGKSITPLLPSLGGGSTIGNPPNPATQTPSTPGSPSAPTGNPPTRSTTTTTTSTTPALPWAGVCRAGSAGGSATTGGLFGDGFFDEIGGSLAGGSAGEGIAYTSGGGVGGSPSLGGASSLDFGLSERSDFFHTPACSGILCITIDMISGSQGGVNPGNSIEGLLEYHSQMMEPISRSDLAAQQMTSNFYEIPFLNLKIKNQIGGAKIYAAESPQMTKKLKTEDTPASRDAEFDAAFRCAMNEVGLPGDLTLANGFIGAGYVGLRDTTSVGNRTISLGPTEMENLRGCYQIRLGLGQQTAYKSLSTDLNEIQGFTSSMMNMILSILDTDRKLDTLPVK